VAALLSDISFVRGKGGWVVIDPVVTAEVVRTAWRLFQEHVGMGLPVAAVIDSHTHGDNWGGVRGIVEEADATLVMNLAPIFESLSNRVPGEGTLVPGGREVRPRVGDRGLSQTR
jgi:glyoxylase-like metal-dependent hydrolase (beta-lactamase superfamily II)